MFFILEPADAVSGFPGMHQNFCILRLIADRARQSAVIFMRVREDDATDIRDADDELFLGPHAGRHSLLWF